MAVTYADGTTPVLPGDRVSVRLFVRRRQGEVIYVPGISRRRGSYEHHGLTWVGVSLPDGWAVGKIVDPETRRLQRSVRFLGRGTESAEGAEAVRRIDQMEEDDDADREEEIDDPDETRPIARPTATDWFAGGVAVALQLGIVLLAFGAIVAAVRLLRRLF